MQILMPRVWGGARESAFLTSSGRVRAAGRGGPRFPGTPRPWLGANQLSALVINRPAQLLGGAAGTCALRPGGGGNSELRDWAAWSRPLVGTRRDPRAMSRRKQANPQHLHNEEPQPARQELARAAPEVVGKWGE